MGELSDDLYRRQEDQRWRDKIDERLASLTTDTIVIQDRLEEAEEKLNVLDLSVRGDAAKETGGLIERMHELEGKISRLWSVIFMDAAGGHGMYEEMRKIQSREHRFDVHWKFYTAVVVAVISTIGLFLTNLDKLRKHFPQQEQPEVQKVKKRPKPTITYYPE